MSQTSCNCIICAEEFNPNELSNSKLLDINITNFKICSACLESSDPDNDYNEARSIVDSYLKFAEKKNKISERIDKITKFQ